MTARLPKKHLKILVTAGPTREPIDPVRFISNYSTGMMGYCIAREAAKRRHRVVLVSGPSSAQKPPKVRLVRVETSLDMLKAVRKHYKASDCVIMASAVSDFRLKEPRKSKIKREKTLTLKLTRNPDILAELGRHKQDRILVGFALETQDLRRNALKKLAKKNLDIIVANKTGKKSPFGSGKTSVLVLEASGKAEELKEVSKQRVAGILLDKIEGLC